MTPWGWGGVHAITLGRTRSFANAAVRPSTVIRNFLGLSHHL